MMNNKKKTLVIGGSLKTERYSNIAIRKLVSYGHPVVSVGLRSGDVAGVMINTGRPDYENVHTVTMYVGPANQPSFYDYILQTNPKRIVFNPGTENDAFEEMAKEKNIEIIRHCTLIMLDQGLY